jgi:hypothetical protein
MLCGIFVTMPNERGKCVLQRIRRSSLLYCMGTKLISTCDLRIRSGVFTKQAKKSWNVYAQATRTHVIKHGWMAQRILEEKWVGRGESDATPPDPHKHHLHHPTRWLPFLYSTHTHTHARRHQKWEREALTLTQPQGRLNP